MERIPAADREAHTLVQPGRTRVTREYGMGGLGTGQWKRYLVQLSGCISVVVNRTSSQSVS